MGRPYSRDPGVHWGIGSVFAGLVAKRNIMKKSLYFGSFAVAGAAILWSLDALLRQQLYDLPPSVVVFWEHLFGLIILLPVVLFSVKKFAQLTKKQWLSIIVVALLSGAAGTVLYTAALGNVQYMSFSVIVLLQQLQPIFAIIAAAILLREPLGGRFFGLTLLALIAAYFVAFPDWWPNFDTGEGTAMAALMAIGAAAAWGISTALSKYTLHNTSALHVTAARFAFTPIFAFLFILFPLIFSGDSSQLEAMSTLSGAQWWMIILITFSTGLVALAIYYYGLKRIPASRSTLLELMWPVSALVISMARGESLAITQWIGAAALLVIMWFVIQNEQVVEAKIKQDE